MRDQPAKIKVLDGPCLCVCTTLAWSFARLRSRITPIRGVGGMKALEIGCLAGETEIGLTFGKLDRGTAAAARSVSGTAGWSDPDTSAIGFLDTLRDGVVIVGSDLRIKYQNASHAEQLGIELSDIQVGDHLRDALLLLARRGKLGPMNGRDPEEFVDERITAWGSEESRVERRQMASGRILDIYRTQTDNNDTVAVHVDVTDQVRSVEELESQRLLMKSLLENTSDGITLLDADGNFAMFNDKFLELYDSDPSKVYWGITYEDMVATFGDLAGLPEPARNREIARRRKFAFDPNITTVRRHLKDGRTLNINKTVLPVGGCVMTMRDMTAELAREEELLKARHLAEESSRHKSEFVARMSHEMRTPLNGILGVAALIERTELSEQQRALVDVISSSGKVLLRLIDDILDLSRMDADSFDVVAEPLDIREVIHQCLAIIKPSADVQGLELRFDGGPSDLPPLRGDVVRIKQILLNLLTNAVKFTEEGHVEVDLGHDRGPEGVTLMLSVRDTGVGIAEDQLDQIFNRFYQIDGTATRRHGGAGLGLAITRKLVDAMGGAIQVRSRPGEGTVFRVSLTLPPAPPQRVIGPVP